MEIESASSQRRCFATLNREPYQLRLEVQPTEQLRKTLRIYDIIIM